MAKKKVGIIGHFGGNENIIDGQTIKTKILHDELQKATNWELIKVDTYYKSKKPLKLIFDTLKCLLSAKDIIILLSRNGMKFYFPFLYLWIKLLHIRIYHDVIGGNLDKYVTENPQFTKYLNSFKVNWVETKGLKNKLDEQGIKNCEVMPNFKRLNITNEKIIQEDSIYRFCIFSRIMKEKGIEDAIEAIEFINKTTSKKLCQLDIYGRIDDQYKEHFWRRMQQTSECIAYKGEINYTQSVEVIKKYYALLFPTYWDGEGFPGTIIDAFSSGVPVIATDWNCNSEIVENKVNGILYPNNEIKNLQSAILWLIKNKDQQQMMKKNCILCAEKYCPDLYIKQMIELIVSRGETL